MSPPVSVYWQRTRDGSEAIEPADLPTLLAHTGKGGGGQDQFIHAAQTVGALTGGTGGRGWSGDNGAGQGMPYIPVGFHMTQDPIHSNGGSPALGRTTSGMGVMASGVRRLTPVECERLQSLPDDWTAPPGLHAPDGRRYAAVGDAVTSNVAQWIGERLLRFG